MSTQCVDSPGSTARYDIAAIFFCLITMLQFLLILHTVYFEVTLRNDKRMQKTQKLRIIYTVQQLIGFLWLSNNLFIMIIDPLTEILEDSIWCKYTAYFSYYCPGPFYGCYFLSLLYRLEMSFKGSYLEPSRFTLYVLATLTLIIPIAPTVTLLADRADSECLEQWDPVDMDRTLYYCMVPPTSMAVFKYFVFAVMVLLINVLGITFSIMFTVKLKKFVNLKKRVTNRQQFMYIHIYTFRE